MVDAGEYTTRRRAAPDSMGRILAPPHRVHELRGGEPRRMDFAPEPKEPAEAPDQPMPIVVDADEDTRQVRLEGQRVRLPTDYFFSATSNTNVPGAGGHFGTWCPTVGANFAVTR
jgi:hypothetical protein